VKFACERPGILGTYSIGGRVRYLGLLADPNELSLVVSLCVPFAFGFFSRTPSPSRLLLLLTTLLVVGLAVVYSASRGGQLVFLSVLGTYFVRRLGVRGLILCALLGAPILIFGGRDTEEARESSLERIECMYTGVQLFLAYPFVGVGQGRFLDHHYLTAHNSYVLAIAELGFPGFVLWSAVMFISVLVPVRVLKDFAKDPSARSALGWAMASLAGMIGMLVGVFFLSFNYKQVLWIFIGLSGALYSSTKRHAPEWKVPFGWRELGMVIGIDLMLVVLLYVYTRVKMAH
jgi:hypothetical protein